ncbi:DUF3006 family protein [Halomarina oriensis]|uniref:DUF3006 family protein n=1 Tax=Halomarina oriensis TaxID=671145 RepID=A0A6B0GY62_9EURY|nr:DUF3006 family protein [Halomarina oriensis]MWG36728.1 DUF3006 family protein [Halomarina oriensis]
MSDDPAECGAGDGVPDGEYRAVVDRIEDGLATLILDDETTTGRVDIPPDSLPDGARQADAVVDLTVEDGRLAEVRFEERATERRRERVQSRFDRLARRRDETTAPEDDRE